ncbi:MAG: hypothetical protein LBL07_00915, partial [Tannerella sp.]|nr:hypothetical protein [Tannerella sp.]
YDLYSVYDLYDLYADMYGVHRCIYLLWKRDVSRFHRGNPCRFARIGRSCGRRQPLRLRN